MLRQRLSEAMKDAMKARDQRATSTTRMILAALKDRDIAERGKGNPDGLNEEQIQGLMQSMVKQRRESIALYEQGGRMELADQERAEIVLIEGFLPQQMDEAETQAVVKGVVAELGIASIKDMGRAMAALKERYAGRMDFAKASAALRQALS